MVLCFLSLAMLLACIRFYGRGGRGEPTVIPLVVVAAVSMFLFVLYFVADYFTGDGINEAVIYHLRYGLSGAGFSEYAALGLLALLAGLTSLAFPWLLIAGRRPSAESLPRGAGHIAAALALAVFSLALHPAIHDLARVMPAQAPAMASFASAETSKRARQAEEDFNRHYVQTAARLAAEVRKNLVFIYAESLERTYFDESIFPGLMPHLRAIESEALVFTDVVQAPGTGWTIAGMVASQCGIPLFTPSHGNSMTGLDSFLPAAVCMGDLLKEDGYHLAYLGGARLRFAGKGKFYKTHGFDEVTGLDELRNKQRDPAYANAWGLHDDELFELAYDRFTTLSSEGDRFGLFLLTLGTHHPDGHLSAACRGMRYGDGGNPILNAAHCSDRLIAGLVGRIRRSEWGRHTLVVIASDHLAMRNSAQQLLETGNRRNLFMVLDPGTPRRTIATPGSMLDVAPTVLQLMGYGTRLGLGSSLLETDAAAVGGRQHVLSRLGDWVVPLQRFWDFPKIGKQLEIDARDRKVIIDGRSYSIPAFITIDPDMSTIIKFPYLASARDMLDRNEPDKAFVLIAECTSMNVRLPDGIDCLFAGTGNQWRSQILIRDKAVFLPEQIMRMTGAGL